MESVILISFSKWFPVYLTLANRRSVALFIPNVDIFVYIYIYVM